MSDTGEEAQKEEDKMKTMKEKLDILMSDPNFLLELETAMRQAKETCDYLTEASKIRWEDLHRPVTI